MAEPYRRYGTAPAEGASASIPAFAGYVPTEIPPMPLPSVPLHGLWGATDKHRASSDYLQNNIYLRSGAYGLDDTSGILPRPEPGLVGLPAGPSIPSYQSPLADPTLINQRLDVSLVIPDTIREGSNSLRNANGYPAGPAQDGESNILFVDGLPTDCTRREVGPADLFRPFIGFKDIRVVHKEPRRAYDYDRETLCLRVILFFRTVTGKSGDKATVLCFVEFNDAKCALTAKEAMQSYKFDNKKPDSPVLKLHFAHFPFRPPSEHSEKYPGGSRRA